MSFARLILVVVIAVIDRLMGLLVLQRDVFIPFIASYAESGCLFGGISRSVLVWNIVWMTDQGLLMSLIWLSLISLSLFFFFFPYSSDANFVSYQIYDV